MRNALRDSIGFCQEVAEAVIRWMRNTETAKTFRHFRRDCGMTLLASLRKTFVCWL